MSVIPGSTTVILDQDTVLPNLIKRMRICNAAVPNWTVILRSHLHFDSVSCADPATKASPDCSGQHTYTDT